MSDRDEGERAHEPSQKRLQDARDRGEVPRSAELGQAFALAAMAGVTAVHGPAAVDRLGVQLAHVLAQPDRIANGANGGAAFAGSMLAGTASVMAPFFVVPLLAVLLSLLIQRAWTVTPSNLSPQLSRISPLAALRQKFGPEGLVDFAKSTARAVLVSALLVWMLNDRLVPVVLSARLDAGQASAFIARALVDFLLAALALALVFGLLDVLVQRFRFLARNRMTRKEVTDEQREAEGDPHARMLRRRRGQEIAMNQMLAEVPRADVVIVNPTHYAVALKWDRGAGGAPVCVAKGTDEMAARIREAAAEAGVPIRRDPPTARALHATTRIGEEIPPEQYRAVAAAIRFAEAMRRRARGRVT